MSAYGELDPNDRRPTQPEPTRLWPWVLALLIVTLCLWAYLEPIPYHTHLEPSGPGPSTYGPSPTRDDAPVEPGLIGPPYPTERPPQTPRQRWCDEYTIPACVWPKEQP